MKRLVFAVAALAALAATATQYSKLSIITTAKGLGRWQGFREWIAQAGLQEEWDAAVYLSDEYPQFSAITNMIVSAGIATAGDVEAILAASVDTAIPDAYIRRLYETDMKSRDGRARWHGQKLREVVDTNTLEKTTYYEDGTIFTDQAKVTTPAQSAQAQLAKLPKPVVTNGVPARLANARIRQRENATATNEVVVVTRAGGSL